MVDNSDDMHFDKNISSTKNLEESHKAQTEFLANVSHELRTPLNGIIGFARLLYEDLVPPNSPQYKEFLGDIITSANRLLSLINDVLDYAKIEAGKMEFHPEKVDFNHLLKETADIFRALIVEKKIDFKIDVDPVLVDVIIDPDKLKHVIYNYIANALKFTPENGKVTVKVFLEKKKNFRFEVSDTGIGIREKDIPKLFVKFQQLDTTSRKTYQGTGLGLALVKHIVEAQGGRVGVESAFGKGSTFYAILPCFPYHRATVPEQQHHPIVTENEGSDTSKRILVIEHESQDRTIMIDALTNAGYNVMIAANVPQAMELFRQQTFVAIILDLYLQDTGSLELLRTLRSPATKDYVPPLVIKTLLEKPISLGYQIQEFLLKPVSEKTLTDAMARIGIQDKKNKSILVIDSDDEAIQFAEKILTPLGFTIICKKNKLTALLTVEQHKPDVVLFDPFMHGLDGLEFLRYFRQTERGPFTPIIIWTNRKLSVDEQVLLKAAIQRMILVGEKTEQNVFDGFADRLSSNPK